MSGSACGDIPADQLEFFEAKVRPLLIDRCYQCHSESSGESEGELRVDTAAALTAGGTRGAAITPGDASASLIYRAVTYKVDDMQMPPDGKIDDAEIEILKRWIEMGAPDPRTGGSVQEREPSPLERDVSEHWAFNTPEQPRAPSGQDSASRDAIDQWAFNRSSKAGLASQPFAGGATQIRRLFFDLTGLPPTSEQVQSFVSNASPTAYTRLVDRLLASPEFGERFGRHWMDVARYADTIGYATAGKERRIKGSERFRDWAITAFATDMPYDEMILNQLAGDRIDPENEAGNLDAMGFITVGRKFLSSVDTMDDRIDVISRGLLGLTVACARCHDHKFDPISTADYYSLYGVLESSVHDAEGPSPLMLRDKPNPRDERVMVRGQRGNRGEIAPRQYLVSLKKDGEDRFRDGSGRLELAQRIASRDNSLTARVMVNRIWQILIGRPLVDSPSDFGFRTEPPAVPEILDELATEFADHWSVKRIVRRIVHTRIYRQASAATAEAMEVDPENELLARANRRRRDFESMRDSMLGVAGLLDRRLGGVPVDISSRTVQPRRTVYAMIDRQNLPALFRTFDFASPDTHSPGRYFTTVPQQALYLMNNSQPVSIARGVADSAAESLREESGKQSIDQSRLASRIFQLVLGRSPDAEERKLVMRLFDTPATPSVNRVDPRTLWSYGTAEMTKNQVTDFTPLPIYKNSQWQTANDFPANGVLAYAFLAAENGHPGGGKAGAVVRRWRAPASGRVHLSGMMGHRSKQGDGVQCRIIVGGEQIFSERQKSNNRPYSKLSHEIQEGEFVELVADMGEGTNSDSFFWRANISLTAENGEVFEADSVADFSGPFSPPESLEMTRAVQLAQTLLISNEFIFVD